MQPSREDKSQKALKAAGEHHPGPQNWRRAPKDARAPVPQDNVNWDPRTRVTGHQER